MLTAAGIVVAARALLPAPPSLAAALSQLNAPTDIAGSRGAVRAQWDWLPADLADLLDAHLGVTDADLRIIGWTRSQLAARKVSLALAGLIAPMTFGLFATAVGLTLPFVIPAGVGVVVAAVIWRLPSAEVRETAAKTRAEFRDALDFYLDLVALERLARGSVTEALEAAAEVSASPPFLRIHAVLERAALSGVPPWTALRDLGDELDIDQLRSLGDVIGIASDGAAVYKTLLAEGRALRHASTSNARAEANAASERMSIPVGIMTIGIMMFVFVPLILGIFGITS